jgi:lipopolysaccharide transport system permease protein
MPGSYKIKRKAAIYCFAKKPLSFYNYCMLNHQSWTILKALTLAETRGRYRNTFAGLLWVILSPIFIYAVHTFVFKSILNIGVKNYNLFLVSGLLPWLFLTGSVSMTCHSFITNRNLLLSIQISPVNLIVAKVADNFFNFCIPYFIILGYLFASGQMNEVTGWLFLPIPMILILVATSTLSLFMAIIQVFFRDTQFILQFLFGILFFITPIFYSPEMIPQKFKWLLYVNPFYAVIKPFQICIWNFQSAAFLQSVVIASVGLLVFIGITNVLWRKKRNAIYLHI